MCITVQKGPAVAFTALMSKDTTVGSKAVVKYNRVLSNVGRAYHPSTGIFTAPYKEIYSIFCSLQSDASNNVHLQITKNDAKCPSYIHQKALFLTPDRRFSYC